MLVLGDSLSFHGPERPELLDEARLWPNVAARRAALRPDVVARAGWTARDGWWALAKDPRVWTSLADPHTRAVVIALGTMDQLPASVPVWVRESIPYIRPGAVRRGVRRTYLAVHPRVVRLTNGAVRQLPQRATEHYWARSVQAVAAHRPELPVVLVGPAPSRGEAYPMTPHHDEAVRAGRAFAARRGLGWVDLAPLVAPMWAAGHGNPDGLHWDWQTHARVGAAVGAALRHVLDTDAMPRAGRVGGGG